MATTQKQESLQTDFEDDVVDDVSEPTKPAKDENGVPYCLVHHVRMKHVSSGKKGSPAAYYKCPVDGCEETGKRIKTNYESSIPSEPHHCPRCSTQEKPAVMSRSKQHSTGYYSILQCGTCGFKSQPMPRPELVAMQRRARMQPVEDIGSR